MTWHVHQPKFLYLNCKYVSVFEVICFMEDLHHDPIPSLHDCSIHACKSCGVGEQDECMLSNTGCCGPCLLLTALPYSVFNAGNATMSPGRHLCQMSSLSNASIYSYQALKRKRVISLTTQRSGDAQKQATSSRLEVT